MLVRAFLVLEIYDPLEFYEIRFGIVLRFAVNERRPNSDFDVSLAEKTITKKVT